MHIVVTGAGGFVGGRITRMALMADHTVTAYTGRRPSGLAPGSHLRVVPGDLMDPNIEFPERFDAVIHCAATSPPDNPVLPVQLDMEHDNDGVTHRLSRVAAGCKRFIYLSSLSVYGKVTSPVLDELHPIAATDTYGMTKFLGETHLRDLPGAVALRLPAIVGPGAVRNRLTLWKKANKDDRPILGFNLDAPFNNALHVDDLSAFCLHLLTLQLDGFTAMNLAADGVTTIAKAIRMVAPSTQIIDADYILPSFTISTDRAKTFGFRPMTIEATLRRYAGE